MIIYLYLFVLLAKKKKPEIGKIILGFFIAKEENIINKVFLFSFYWTQTKLQGGEKTKTPRKPN